MLTVDGPLRLGQSFTITATVIPVRPRLDSIYVLAYYQRGGEKQTKRGKTGATVQSTRDDTISVSRTLTIDEPGDYIVHLWVLSWLVTSNSFVPFGTEDVLLLSFSEDGTGEVVDSFEDEQWNPFSRPVGPFPQAVITRPPRQINVDSVIARVRRRHDTQYQDSIARERQLITLLRRYESNPQFTMNVSGHYRYSTDTGTGQLEYNAVTCPVDDETALLLRFSGFGNIDTSDSRGRRASFLLRLSARYPNNTGPLETGQIPLTSADFWLFYEHYWPNPNFYNQVRGGLDSGWMDITRHTPDSIYGSLVVHTHPTWVRQQFRGTDSIKVVDCDDVIISVNFAALVARWHSNPIILH